MKKTLLITLFATATLIACKEQENNDLEEMVENTTEQVEETTVDIEDAAQETITYTKENVTALANDFESNVEVKDDNIVAIKGYDSYTVLRTNIMDLSTVTEDNINSRSESLRNSFNSFKSTIPAYLRIDDVQDAIEDVEKEIKEYEEERVGEKASTKNNKENMEEIQEAFDDLEKEIIQARKKYVDNKEDAMEEYMEEINSSRKQSTTEKYLDATEEYNEEIKDK
ncbi:hypothetical protein BST92_07380 [Nonlabens arenilitoris]|uniref:Uncharacterized protein n=1 Tax=Nonlabens arenilitoris TaxID=1217969 RepID=A0A2S7U9Z7_9FLAO|nr:hypothetical protein [Nonlabens arenilitoris]PQJ31755.1 hypothetical protein BST92_07380 [Nonlabens arenilitoris]